MKSERNSLGVKSRVKTWVELVHQGLIETLLFSRVGWRFALILCRLLNHAGWIRSATSLAATGQRSCPYLDIRTSFGVLAAVKVEEIAGYPLTKTATSPHLIASRVKVLKPFIDASEKGVLHIMYSEAIAGVTTLVDIRMLAPYYRLVIEPSWAGYADAGPMRYASCGTEVIVMCPDAGDYDFIGKVGRGMIPVRLGAGDWVDPRIAEPYLGVPKEYDIIMNANWAPWKRHHVLFNALARASKPYKVALIGGALDGVTVERIYRLATYYGVADQIETFEKVPFNRVMSIIARAKCSLLLSLKEGANRALPESMFCDVPVLALNRNVGGVEKNIVAQTGVLVDDDRLLEGIEFLLGSLPNLKPREWAMANISCVASTHKLNALLRDVAVAAGERWSMDIAVRANSPESRYFSEEDAARLQEPNQVVLDFLARRCERPV
jgi:glycosyltransferase involved in cell wall biosynthesis